LSWINCGNVTTRSLPTPRHQHVNRNPVRAIDKPARAARDGVDASAHPFPAKTDQAIRGQKEIDVLGCALGAMGVHRHASHDRIRYPGLLQQTGQAAHCLVDLSPSGKKQVDLP
jgi:hypothetical protein